MGKCCINTPISPLHSTYQVGSVRLRDDVGIVPYNETFGTFHSTAPGLRRESVTGWGRAQKGFVSTQSVIKKDPYKPKA